MSKRVKHAVRQAKLAYLWITRIFLAPNKREVSLAKKLDMNLRGGFLADQYALYDFDNEDRAEYLSEFDWYRSRYINAPFDSMLNNKVVATELLKGLAAVPEVLLIKNRGWVSEPGNPVVDKNIARAFNVIEGAGSVFMKPIGAGKGIGVYRIDFKNDEFFLDGERTNQDTLNTLFTEEDAWFLSETVEQHPRLADLFPGATNTLRVVTLRDPETGELEIFFAVLRVGTKETGPVDNGSRGGLVAKVDLETGTTVAARRLWEDGEHRTHPDTGSDIENFQVPRWGEVKDLTLKLAQAFPYLHMVAWDILVGEEDIVVIEANTSTGVNIIQMWGPQRQDTLGDFFRAHGAIK